MNLLFLPGNDKRNLKWAHEVTESLRPLFSIIRVGSYHHWQTGAPFIDMELEQKNMSELTNNFSPYILLAKSIGVLLALKCMKEGSMNPQKCVFLGTPVRLANRMQYPLESWLHEYRVPTLWIQKDEDPACRSRILLDLLKTLDVPMSTFIEIPGENHHYEVSEVQGLIEEYASRGNEKHDMVLSAVVGGE